MNRESRAVCAAIARGRGYNNHFSTETNNRKSYSDNNLAEGNRNNL